MTKELRKESKVYESEDERNQDPFTGSIIIQDKYINMNSSNDDVSPKNHQ